MARYLVKHSDTFTFNLNLRKVRGCVNSSCPRTITDPITQYHCKCWGTHTTESPRLWITFPQIVVVCY